MDLVGPMGIALEPDLDALMHAIASDAEQVDASGVRRSTLDALAAAGAASSCVPADMQREVTERLAMADASTWFCWAQHLTPTRTLDGRAPGFIGSVPVTLVDEYLRDLQSGRLLAAVAFAHVRRPGPPNPVAQRVEGGWRFTGGLDWVTSWDIADVVMIVARAMGSDEGLLVCAYLPAGRADRPVSGLVPGPVLDLLAMSGTYSRPVELTDVFVPDECVVLADSAEWSAVDAVRTADVSPAVFGVTRGAISELDDLATQRHDERMAALAHELAQRCSDIRARAYRAADDDADVALRVRLRAEALALAVDASVAVIVARAGAAMHRGRSAERRLREAMFLQVQAQTAVSRAASLDLLQTRVSPAP